MNVLDSVVRSSSKISFSSVCEQDYTLISKFFKIKNGPKRRGDTEQQVPHLVRKFAQRLETLLFSCNEHFGVTCDRVGWPSINIK